MGHNLCHHTDLGTGAEQHSGRVLHAADVLQVRQILRLALVGEPLFQLFWNRSSLPSVSGWPTDSRALALGSQECVLQTLGLISVRFVLSWSNPIPKNPTNESDHGKHQGEASKEENRPYSQTRCGRQILGKIKHYYR